VAAMGIASVELIPPEQWPILKRHGLVCAMTPSHSFLEGWCHPENHVMCKAKIEEAVDATSAAGFPSVITFSGLRKGMPDDVGLEKTVAGLKTVIGHAERKKVTLCLEVLNTRVKQFDPYIGHYHTAGVPGRHEIDETQEINYPAVMRAIANTGFTGYV